MWSSLLARRDMVATQDPEPCACVFRSMKAAMAPRFVGKEHQGRQERGAHVSLFETTKSASCEARPLAAPPTICRTHPLPVQHQHMMTVMTQADSTTDSQVIHCPRWLTPTACGFTQLLSEQAKRGMRVTVHKCLSLFCQVWWLHALCG